MRRRERHNTNEMYKKKLKIKDKVTSPTSRKLKIFVNTKKGAAWIGIKPGTSFSEDKHTNPTPPSLLTRVEKQPSSSGALVLSHLENE